LIAAVVIRADAMMIRMALMVASSCLSATP